METTRSKVSSGKGGSNRFICTNCAFAIEQRSRNVLREAKRVQVGADHRAAPVHCQEVRQLSGAATRFQHQRRTRQLLVEQAREHPAFGLRAQAVPPVQVVVAGERRLLVERLDHVGHIGLALRQLVGREQARNSVHHRVAACAVRARRLSLVLKPAQWLQVDRAVEMVQDIEKRQRFPPFRVAIEGALFVRDRCLIVS